MWCPVERCAVSAQSAPALASAFVWVRGDAGLVVGVVDGAVVVVVAGVVVLAGAVGVCAGSCTQRRAISQRAPRVQSASVVQLPRDCVISSVHGIPPRGPGREPLDVEVSTQRPRGVSSQRHGSGDGHGQLCTGQCGCAGQVCVWSPHCVGAQ